MMFKIISAIAINLRMPYQCGALPFRSKQRIICLQHQLYAYIVNNLRKFDHVSIYPSSEAGGYLWNPLFVIVPCVLRMFQLFYHSKAVLLDPPILNICTYSTQCPPTFSNVERYHLS